MRQPVFQILIFLFCVCLSGGAGASDKALKPPFDVDEIRTAKGKAFEEEFKCPPSPDAVRDLHFESFYQNERASEINEEAYAVYINKYKPLRLFEKNVISWANNYVQAAPPREDYARCVLSWLHDWSREKAMLGEMTHNGEFIRKWILASLALSYEQIKDAPSLDKEKKDRVEAWLHDLGNAALIDFSTKTERRSRQNNHLYWAAWAVGITGVAVQEPKFYHWAMDRAEYGIAQIKEDGTLPHELYRESRALQYHLFAAMPLVMLAELSAANGRDLYALNDGRLHRLVKRSLAGIDDPSYIAKKAGGEQNMERVKNRSIMAWVEAYDARFPDRERRRIEKLRNELPPFMLSRVGGDTALLYAKP